MDGVGSIPIRYKQQSTSDMGARDMTKIDQLEEKSMAKHLMQLIHPQMPLSLCIYIYTCIKSEIPSYQWVWHGAVEQAQRTIPQDLFHFKTAGSKTKTDQNAASPAQKTSNKRTFHAVCRRRSQWEPRSEHAQATGLALWHETRHQKCLA